MHRLQRILETALGKKMALPERKLESMAQFLERFPEVKEVLLDGTERPVQRPKDSKKQKAHYSGKKKRHTRKHITVSTAILSMEFQLVLGGIANSRPSSIKVSR